MYCIETEEDVGQRRKSNNSVFDDATARFFIVGKPGLADMRKRQTVTDSNEEQETKKLQSFIHTEVGERDRKMCEEKLLLHLVRLSYNN